MDWAEAIRRDEPVVVEQSRVKVLLVLWGLAVPGRTAAGSSPGPRDSRCLAVAGC